jgi:invasion protein IalB
MFTSSRRHLLAAMGAQPSRLGLAERCPAVTRSASEIEISMQLFRNFSVVKTMLRAGATATVAALALGAGGSSALAQAQVKAKFGDWEMRCETPAGSPREQCAIIQSVAAEDKPNMNLVVIALKAADGKSRLLRVIAPLGVLLPAGLGLNIDNADKGRAGFVRCLPSGCVAEVVMDDKLLDDLGNGNSATFIVFETPEAGIGIPLTLKGFKEGFGKLP